MSIAVQQLSPIGAEIVGARIETLLEDEHVPSELMDLLDANGVLVFRGLGLDDARQVALARRLGDVQVWDRPGWSVEYPGIYSPSLHRHLGDPYFQGTFNWHLDAVTNEIPDRGALLTARSVSASGGGETQFVSTYGAYDRLSEDEKARFGNLKVWHSMETLLRRLDPDPPPDVLERLRNDRLCHLQPLVWTHSNGRKSLVVSAYASHVEGMPEDEGAAIVADLLDRATRPSYVYSHRWQVGDLVIWDNWGVLHRAVPYADDSGREMHRVSLAGHEPIR